MAASINLSATRMNIFAKDYNCTSAGLLEGAVVAHSATEGDNVGAVSGAAAVVCAGVISSFTGSSGTAANDRVTVQKMGQGQVLLAAGATVVPGDELITAAAAGTVKKRTSETGVIIIGRSECARTAGAAAEMIPCFLTLNFIP